MSDLELGIVVSARTWDEQLHRFTVDHGGARVRIRVLSPEDAVAESFDVMVVDDITSFLTRHLVDVLHSQKKLVLGVFDPDTAPDGERRLKELGIDHTVEASAAPEEFLRVLDRMAEQLGPRSIAATPGVASSAEVATTDGGSVLVVGGPEGGVGSTEIAVALARRLRGGGRDSVLVDADDVNPSVAQRLGLPLHPNLRTAVDALQHRSEAFPDSMTFPKHVEVEVLAGLSNPRDWIELRPSEVVSVIDELASEKDSVVVDISARLEDLSYFGGPPRYALARALVARADVVVAVGLPTPIGVARLLQWVAAARDVAPDTGIHIVVNKAPKAAYMQGELQTEIVRSYLPASLTFIPEDRRVEAAAWEGEAVPSGPFQKGVQALAEALRPVRSHRA